MPFWALEICAMEILRCDYCGYYGGMVFVHSHYMCPHCKNCIAPPFEEDESAWLFDVAEPEVNNEAEDEPAKRRLVALW